jgi:hypothetical protein
MAVKRVLAHTGNFVPAAPRPTAPEFITKLERSAAHKSVPLVAKNLAVHRNSFARNYSCKRIRLLVRAAGVIHVVTAVTTAKRRTPQ